MAADLNCNTPGRRPWGFWRYDIGLEPDGGLGFHWPRGCCSEAETIYRYHADAAERLAIEAEWRDAMRIAIAQSRGAPSPDPEGNAEAFAGVPRSFYRRHAGQVHAD